MVRTHHPLLPGPMRPASETNQHAQCTASRAQLERAHGEFTPNLTKIARIRIHARREQPRRYLHRRGQPPETGPEDCRSPARRERTISSASSPTPSLGVSVTRCTLIDTPCIGSAAATLGSAMEGQLAARNAVGRLREPFRCAARYRQHVRRFVCLLLSDSMFCRDGDIVTSVRRDPTVMMFA